MTLRSRLARVADPVAAVLGASLIAGALDGLLTLVRGPSEPQFLLVSSGLFVVMGFVPGLVMLWVAARVLRAWGPVLRQNPQRAVWAAAGLVALTVLGVLLVVAATVVFERRTPPAAARRIIWLAVAAAVVSLAALRAAAWLLARVRGGPYWAFGAWTVGLVLAIPAASHTMAEIDLRFVWVLAGYAAGLTLLAWRVPHSSRRLRMGLWLAGPIIAVAGTAALIGQPPMRLLAARYAPVSGAAARLIGALADLDGDGYSPLSGEGDCDPTDANIHPFAVEVAGNGIDEDCSGADLDPAVLARRTDRPVAAPVTKDRPHVFLITVDTLRVDRMGLYGYERDTTPQIDEAFADAVVFERAYTTSPVTDRAFQSLVGGLYPSMYTEALDYDTHVLADRRVLLGERMHDAGYHTIAINSFRLFSEHGLAQGFVDVQVLDSFKTQDARRMTQRSLRTVRAALADGKHPLFVWLHYYEPHSRYTPPKRHRHWDGGGDFASEDPSDLYDAEIRYADDRIGRVLEYLAGSNLLDSSVVVFTSDHGEEFLEHGSRGHSRKLYDESMRVPLMVLAPGVSPARIQEPVSLVDLMPTILDLVDIPSPEGIEGRSQASAVRGGPVDARPLFMEQFRHGSSEVEKIGVVDGHDKLMLDLKNQLWEQYDLLADPGESDNRYGHDLGRSLELRTVLLAHWARVQAARALAAPDGAF